MIYLKLYIEGTDSIIECTSETQESAFQIYYSFIERQRIKNIHMRIITDVIDMPGLRLNFEKGIHIYCKTLEEGRFVELFEQPIKKVVLSCTNCAYEKMSSPLYIRCIGCNRNKGLVDKFLDKDEPTRG